MERMRLILRLIPHSCHRIFLGFCWNKLSSRSTFLHVGIPFSLCITSFLSRSRSELFDFLSFLDPLHPPFFCFSVSLFIMRDQLVEICAVACRDVIWRASVEYSRWFKRKTISEEKK